MTIKTYKGKLPIGEEEKIHLSTNDGLTGYKIVDFKIISSTPGAANVELIGKIRLTQDANIGATVDFSDVDLLAIAQSKIPGGSSTDGFAESIIFADVFNQDIFVNITDAGGGTVPANFYIELEQFKLDLNTSTYHTLKNIRSLTDPGFTFV